MLELLLFYRFIIYLVTRFAFIGIFMSVFIYQMSLFTVN